jgi:hypothetical protein
VVQWVFVSVILSVALTVLVNVALRFFPDLTDRVARGIEDLTTPNRDDPPVNKRRVRVFVPWKAMILGSLILTVLINVALRLT